MNNEKIPFVILIHTEEEFDWRAGFSRENNAVEHAQFLYRVQDIFDELGFRAGYLIGYPLLSDPNSLSVIRELSENELVEIGCHMHAWVTPPYGSSGAEGISYQHLLPAALEREKLVTLTRKIEAEIGVRPKSFLGGRYGFGPNTGEVLKELGYKVDFSANATGDYTDDGGPDYSRISLSPTWHNDNGQLLRAVGTGAYLGCLHGAGPQLNRVLRKRIARNLRLEGILSRLGMFETLRLSPEGYSFDELRRLTDTVVERGADYLVYSFHSPSVMPGCTPYVQSDDDLMGFLDDIRRYLTYINERSDVESVFPFELWERYAPIETPSR